MDKGHRPWAQVVDQLAQDHPIGQRLAQVLCKRDLQVGLDGLEKEKGKLHESPGGWGHWARRSWHPRTQGLSMVSQGSRQLVRRAWDSLRKAWLLLAHQVSLAGRPFAHHVQFSFQAWRASCSPSAIPSASQTPSTSLDTQSIPVSTTTLQGASRRPS